MNESMLRAFLDDIKANPLDDAPRLILADWLEENGETDADRARGTLMRAQCQDDVTVADALLERHRADWLGALGAVARSEFSFERGLIAVTAPMEQLLDGWLIRSSVWRWVETLEVVGQEGRLTPLWRLPVLAEVSTLRLNAQPVWGHVRMAHMLGSPYLGRLRGLDFAEQQLSGYHLATFARWDGLGWLHHLGFRGMILEETGLESLAASPFLESLQRLELGSIRTSARGLRALLRCDRLPCLRDLALPASDPDLEILPALAGGSLASVAGLNLAGVGLLDDGATVLAGLTLPALRRLNLSGCGIGTTGGTALAEAPWLGHLERLDLASNRLGGSMAGLLGGNLRRLTRLSLENSGLGITLMEALAAAPHLPRLERLDLGDNRFDLAALNALARVRTLPALRRLSLSGCGVSERGTLALADWPGVANLDVLDLRGNNLGESGLAALRERVRTILL